MEPFQEKRFAGGRIVARPEGEMFDQKTGKKTAWGRGIKILGATKPITLDAGQVAALIPVLESQDVINWLNEIEKA